MIIRELIINNFKSIGRSGVEFSPGVTTIYGANGSGKTTRFDAFCWCLFGKDSQDRTQGGNLSFYPFDPEKQGEILHNVVVDVEVILQFESGNIVRLRRVMQEKYTTPKGTETPRFTGNETTFYIDDLAVQAKQYEAWIKTNIQPEMFKLTSNPKYFPTLDWRKQREILMELAGDISADDVIATNESLAPLKDELAKRTAAELKKLWQQQQKANTKDLEKTVVLINENRKNLASVDNADAVKAELEAQRILAMKPLDAARQEKADILSGTAVDKKKAQAEALEARLEVIRMERRAKIAEVKKPFDEAIAKLESEAATAATTIKGFRQQVIICDNKIREMQEKLEALQGSWESVDAEVFDEVCPCCHRPYEPEQLERQLAEFNQRKAERLDEIDKEGEKTAKMLAAEEVIRDEAMKEVQRLSSIELDMPAKRSEVMRKREEAVQALPPMENRQDWFEASEDLKCVNREIDELQIDVKLKLQDAEKAIERAEKPVRDIDARLAEIKAAEANRARITELETAQQNLRVVNDELALKLNLLKKFEEAKAVITTQRVKAILPGMDFKLFIYNSTNEGYSETCELVKDGTPYANLSTGEKIAVGCELITAISQHYGVSNPVWIDNAEASTKDLMTSGQTILLKVSAVDTELRVERDGEEW